MTVASLIDRCYREWLTPPDEQPARFKINDAGGISSSDTSVITDTSWLSPEEEDLIGPGTIIEIGRELLLVEAVSGTSPALTLTIRRGMFDTTAASHADASEIILAPTYGRQAVYDAVSDAIDDLWPSLWAIKTDIIPTSSSWAEVNAEVEEVLETKIQVNSQWITVSGGQVELLIDFPLASSQRAVQFGSAIPKGKTAIIKYKVRPSRPSAETDTLASLDIDDSWQKAITVGVAASLLRGADVTAATVEYVTEALEREGFPPGAGESVSNALLRYQDFLIQRRSRAQDVRTLAVQVVEKVL